MPSVAIKICGLRETTALDEAVKLGCAYMGMIFFPASPRHVSIEQAAKLSAHARGRIKTVAVLVDTDDALLKAIADQVKPDFLQLHGTESPEHTAEIKKRFGIPVIKAIKVSSGDDIARANAYASSADMLLFDAKTPGSGQTFDWQLLASRAIPLPWMLSGGLNAGNVAEAIRISGARMVDVSSGVESSPGVKDLEKMRAFVKAANNGVPATR